MSCSGGGVVRVVWKDGTVPVQGCRDRLEAPQDLRLSFGPGIDQDQVAVAAHDLGNQGFGSFTPLFIGCQEMQVEYSLQGRLLHGDQLTPAQVLAQQHTKSRRGGRPGIMP